jgi:hypothetical protein
MHTVNAGFDQATRERSQGIAGVDRDGPVLGSHPLPLSFGVENLKGSYRLSEKQSHSSQVSVAGTIQLADLLVLLGAASCVVHVAQVVLTLDVVLVVFDQLILIRKLKENGEEAEQLLYYFSMAFL